ncbi:MAG: hypothetical protein IJN80_03600 [Clostridia bacterium]|nr:hypothetical protein [Clostridia bacterium]
MSVYDQLLLSDSQVAEIKKAQKDYIAAKAAGDRAGMSAAHARAEQVRSQAGYSGGPDGSTYRLLGSADPSSGYDGYKAIVDHFAASGMNQIATNYENTMKELAEEREKIERENDQNQSAARSSVWNTKRLAQDGFLTRGLENTGIADVITATALNQASANAYQALLDRQNDLMEADLKGLDAKAEALSEANKLQSEAVDLLTHGYSSFYENEADRKHDLLLGQLEYDRALEKDEIDYRKDLALDSQNHQQELELSKLAHQYDIDLSKLNNQQKQQLAEQEYQYQLAIAKLKRAWEKEDR